MKASEGELIRIREQITRLRATLDSFELYVGLDISSLESAMALSDAASRLATTAARRDAYLRAEAQVDELQSRLDDVCERCQESCKHAAGPIE